MKRLWLSIIAFFILAATSSAQTIDHAKLLQTLDSLRSHYGIPELAVAIVHSDSISFTGVCGYRNMNTKEAGADTDLFHLGSDTKAITSLIAAKLVQEGKL